MKKLNDQLLDLYLSKWSQLRGVLLSYNDKDEEGNENDDSEDDATHPLLIKVNGNFPFAKSRIMFFGKETNTWYKEFVENSSIDNILKGYDEFYLKKGFETYNSPFWHYFKALIDRFEDVEFFWNNLLKIGKNSSGTPQRGLINETEKHFNVIMDEICILKPSLLLFFTGPLYDQYIKRFIGEFKIKEVVGFCKNEFCEIIFVDNPDLKAFRTYHPQYLNMIKRKRELENKQDITTQIYSVIEDQLYNE